MRSPFHAIISQIFLSITKHLQNPLIFIYLKYSLAIAGIRFIKMNRNFALHSCTPSSSSSSSQEGHDRLTLSSLLRDILVPHPSSQNFEGQMNNNFTLPPQASRKSFMKGQTLKDSIEKVLSIVDEEFIDELFDDEECQRNTTENSQNRRNDTGAPPAQ